MKRYAIANQKGGVGKTTFARNLTFYALEKGLRVLCLDLDPQRNFSKTLHNFRMRNHIESDADESTALKARDLFSPDDGKLPLSCGGNAALIAAERDLIDVAELSLDSLQQPRQVLDRLSKDYDVCIIDTAPTLGNPLYAALIATDFVICPCTIDQDATDGLADLFGDIERVRRTWHSELKPLGVLANCVTKRAFDQQGLDALKEALGSMLLPTTLYERAATKYAKDRAVWQTAKGESNIQAAQEMKAACEFVFRKSGLKFSKGNK